MRIDRLRVKNFRGFSEREFEFPQSIGAQEGTGSFHVAIGDNAKGKTAMLEALSVAMASLTNAFPEAGKRNFTDADVRIVLHQTEDTERIEEQLPVEVEAQGLVFGKRTSWKRQLRNKRTTTALDRNVRELAETALTAARNDLNYLMPLVCYFGTQRLFSQPKDTLSSDKTTDETLKPTPIMESDTGFAVEKEKAFRSRLAGYWYANDARTSPKLLQRWLMLEQQRAFSKGKETYIFYMVKAALRRCIADCTGVKVDPLLGLVIETKQGGRLPFDRLSDGQRTIAAMVGELAWRAAQLNPNLREDVFKKTPGIVLIDELDMHLHPTWQRRIVEDLRGLFPEVQFIATTHSPLVVQSMREGEVIQLDPAMGTIANTENRPLDTIVKGLMLPKDASFDDVTKLMGVSEPETSQRYGEMKGVATQLLSLLERLKKATPEERERIKDEVAGVMKEVQAYSDNPAFQAFLEMRRIAAFKE